MSDNTEQVRITLEIVPNKDGVPQEVILYMNRKGRAALIEELEILSEQDDHFHLMTEYFTGFPNGLREVRYFEKNLLGHHLKVCLRTDEMDQRLKPELLYKEDED